MPRNRKLLYHNAVSMVTARTEEGLPFLASLYMNFILWGILARARRLYDIKVCHFIFMANHLHMLLVVHNPEHCDDFMRYVKTESSHAVNRLCGRRKKTVWCEGYDSPLIFNTNDAIRYIVYIYTNPAKSLSRSIKQYRGISSWWMFSSKTLTRKCPWVQRTHIPKVAKDIFSQEAQVHLLMTLKEKLSGICEFSLEPNAWMACLPDAAKFAPEDLNKRIMNEIQTQERELLKAKTLSEEPQGLTLDQVKQYRPKKFSPRSVCICSDLEFRQRFLIWYRFTCALARNVFEATKKGGLAYYPPGIFAPGGIMTSCLLPELIFR